MTKVRDVKIAPPVDQQIGRLDVCGQVVTVRERFCCKVRLDEANG